MTSAGKQLSLGQLDATCLANVAPSGRNFKVLSYPGLRRHPGALPRVMHGAALWAELDGSDGSTVFYRGRIGRIGRIVDLIGLIDCLLLRTDWTDRTDQVI